MATAEEKVIAPCPSYNPPMTPPHSMTSYMLLLPHHLPGMQVSEPGREAGEAHYLCTCAGLSADWCMRGQKQQSGFRNRSQTWCLWRWWRRWQQRQHLQVGQWWGQAHRDSTIWLGQLRVTSWATSLHQNPWVESKSICEYDLSWTIS